MSPERLLRLDSRCPYCNAAANVRISETFRAQMLTTPSDEQIGTYHCLRCGQGYPVTAGAYQRATSCT